MYSEFCLILDKKNSLNNAKKCTDFGSLLNTQTQSYRLGNVHAFLRSYELKASISDNKIILLLGDAIYNGKLYQDAQQMQFDDLNVNDFVENSRGNFLIIEIDTQKESVSLRSDPLSLYPVYWFENEKYAALSNVPIWMESILSASGVKLARDGLLAGYDLAIGTGAFGVTGWSDFHLIPFGSLVLLGQSKLEFHESRPIENFFKTNDCFDTLIEKSVLELKDNIKAIANSNYVNKVSDITGGMDSRLVLATIFSQGLKDEFLYHTNGEYPVPDANCALSIMENFNLTRIRNSCQYSQSVATNPITTFKEFIYQSQGSRFIYDRAFETNCVQSHLIKVGGGLAGGFKSTYSLRLKTDEDSEVSLEDAVNAMFLPTQEYLSDSLIKRINGELSEFIESINKKYGVSYKTAMDFLYVLSRNRYFIGVGEFPNSAIRPKVHALYSESLIKAAMKITDKERAAGRIHYEIMKKLSPELLVFPFADQVWSSVVQNKKDGFEVSNQLPITTKSSKLYNKVNERVVEITSVGQASMGKEEVEKLDKRWREKQKSLGRNWMWRNFDNIHTLTLKYVEQNYSISEDIFDKQFLNKLFGKKYSSYNRSAEVRSVINILMLMIFKNNGELSSRVEFE